MKKHLTKVAIFLLAGAVVNVGVAWGIVAYLQTLNIDWAFHEPVDLEDPESFKWWTTHAPDGFVNRAADVMLSSPITGASIVIAATDIDDTAISGQSMVRLRTGWPMRSMEGARWENAGDRLYRGAVEFGGWGGANLNIFPLRPFWPGFVFNSLFYGAALWVLIPGPFALRRQIRRQIRQRRGLCPACGYDLRHGEHEACPECGVTA